MPGRVPQHGANGRYRGEICVDEKYRGKVTSVVQKDWISRHTVAHFSSANGISESASICLDLPQHLCVRRSGYKLGVHPTKFRYKRNPASALFSG